MYTKYTTNNNMHEKQPTLPFSIGNYTGLVDHITSDYQILKDYDIC
jgi:hypothetical protein